MSETPTINNKWKCRHITCLNNSGTCYCLLTAPKIIEWDDEVWGCEDEQYEGEFKKSKTK